MNKGMRIKPQPFESFRLIFMVLQVAGYCKLFNPRNKCTETLHKIYRLVVVVIVFVYTAQHGAYAIIMRKDPAKFLEGTVLTIPEIALCYKVIAMFQTKRLNKLEELMKDPIFGASNKQDEEQIKRNSIAMQKLSKCCMGGLSCVAFFWIAAPIFQRFQDETTVVASYMPFEMNTWPRFLLAQFLDTGVILWVGYGAFQIDCLIAAYYAQSRLQLKIIKYNLEHMFDPETEREKNDRKYQFLDVLDRTAQERFVHYVVRYEKVLWFTNEVTVIFGSAISFQLFLTSVSTCLVVYQMSMTDTMTVQFAFLVGYYLAVQFQIFVYCYYGGLVEYESKFVANSLYLGEWLSLSPRFRRQFLIAMPRWITPITPRVSNIVPLSLTTFISITRSAYTLYTVLKNNNNRGNGERTLAF